MSKLRKKLTYKEGAPFIRKGELDVTEGFRKAISEAIKKSGYSREQVVELIEIMTNQRISKHMLDQATSSKKEYRFPAEVLHAFCVITGSLEPFRVLLRAIGCEVVDPAEEKALRLARLLKEKERIEREIEKLKREMEVEYVSNA
jgi:cell division septum initiation protein DivIVA